MKILLINPSTSCPVETILRDAKHQVAIVPDWVDGLKRMGKEEFEAAILNLGSPGAFEGLARLLKVNSSLPVIVFTSEPTIDSVVQAMRMGVFDYLIPPFTGERLKPAVERLLRAKSGRSPSRQGPPEFGDFHSEHPEMRKTIEMVFRTAHLPMTVLLLGESGTGKSVLARAIHEQSPWAERAFVMLNCPCLKSELLESELFGHQRGSFTGAITDTWGKVAAAEGGTLFLDEVGELPLEIQPKLLRLLQDREYERVGETKVRRANVRVIAATNRNLEQAVKSAQFREDLYYRLNVVSVTIPPLRERPKDLIRNAERFLKSVSLQIDKNIQGFTPSALEQLQAYHWPGNLRELKNVIERAAILCDQERIDLGDLPDKLHSAKPLLAQVGAQVTLKKLETEHIRRVIAESQSFIHAARILGIDPGTLNRKRKRMQQAENPLSIRRGRLLRGDSSTGSDSATPKYQRGNEEDHKNNEQELCDPGSRSRNSSEPENGCNNCDDKEKNRIA